MFEKILQKLQHEFEEVEKDHNSLRDSLFDIASRSIKSESKRVGVDSDRWLLSWDSRGLCITEDYKRACSYYFTDILEMLNALPDGAGYSGVIPAITKISPVEYFLGYERTFFDIGSGQKFSETEPTEREANHE